MQTDHRLLDDLARVASGALGTLTGVREDVEARIRERFERILGDMDIVTRDEFEAVKEMAARARAENETLKKRIEALEAAAAKPAKKSARAKSTGPKGETKENNSDQP